LIKLLYKKNLAQKLGGNDCGFKFINTEHISLKAIHYSPNATKSHTYLFDFIGFKVYEVDKLTFVIISTQLTENPKFPLQESSQNLYVHLSADKKSVQSINYEFHKQKIVNDGTITEPILRTEFNKIKKYSLLCK